MNKPLKNLDKKALQSIPGAFYKSLWSGMLKSRTRVTIASEVEIVTLGLVKWFESKDVDINISTNFSKSEFRKILETPANLLILVVNDTKISKEAFKSMRLIESSPLILLIVKEGIAKYRYLCLEYESICLIEDLNESILQTFFDKIIQQKLGTIYLSKGEPPNLTETQLETLQLLVSGVDSTQIYTALGLSQQTAHARIKKLYDIFGVKSPTQLIIAGIRSGLVR